MRGAGEVVAITGASAGIGRATALEFAKRGAKIGLIARGVERLESTKREVQSLGGQAVVCPADVADYELVEAAAGRIEETFGPPDIRINNAMTAVFAPVRQMKPDEYRRVTEVTYLGQVHGALAALRTMRTRDRGTIVFVGSALAYRSIPLQSSYCAAKHAVQGFFESLRSELIHERSNVKVTMVQLPGVNTPQFTWVRNKMPRKTQPVGGKMVQPEVAAEAIYWAAHHDRRELIVGFSAAEAIYGNKLAPGFADKKVAQIAWEGQMTGEPSDPNRPDNLFEPPPGDPGAHGPFDARAKDRSLQLEIATSPLAKAALGLGALALIGGGLFASRRMGR